MLLSYFLAKSFGDKAGTQAAIEYEEEKSARALKAALQNLSQEALLAYSTAEMNANKNIAFYKLPTRIFEQSLLSRESPLFSLEDSKKLSWITISIRNYLTQAYLINTQIELYHEIELSLITAEPPDSAYKGRSFTQGAVEKASLGDELSKKFQPSSNLYTLLNDIQEWCDNQSTETKDTSRQS